MMATSVPLPPTSGTSNGGDLHRPLRLAAAAFALFVAGAAMTMTMAGLFSPLLLVLAASINLPAMLAICAATAAALDLGATHDEGGPNRRTRIARRTLHLASLYWAAAGLAFLLSPFLARL